MFAAPASVRRSPLRAALAVLAVVAAMVVAAPAPASAGPGFPTGESATRTFTYEVRTRGTVLADVGELRRAGPATMNDRRGWSLGRLIRVPEVAPGGPFPLRRAA